MDRRLLPAAIVTIFSCTSVAADDGKPDGDQLAECHAIYDAMVGLGDARLIPPEDKAAYEAKRAKAEASALARYDAEGLDEENARGQLQGRAEYMRDELREIHNGVGIYGADDMRKMSENCDGLTGR